MKRRDFTHKALAGQRGFTLIEVLAVIIIGILAGIAIPVFLSQRERAHDAAAKSVVRNAATSIVSYRVRAGVYPGGDAASVYRMEDSQPTTDWRASKDTLVSLDSDAMVGAGPCSAREAPRASASNEERRERYAYGTDGVCDDPYETGQAGGISDGGW